MSDRKSSFKSARQVQAQATEAMAEPAYTIPEFRQRWVPETSCYFGCKVTPEGQFKEDGSLVLVPFLWELLGGQFCIAHLYYLTNLVLDNNNLVLDYKFRRE